MGLTRLCLNNPAAVAVAVALVFVIGTISLFGLPVQLFPNIERPVVNINTGLRAASPEQVEAEILEPQEEVLRGISGLKETIGWANPGDANLQLYFDFSADQDFIRQEVTARLQRAPALPADANRPFIRFSDEEDANSSLIFFFVQALPGNNRPIEDYQREIEDLVVPRLEAIEGVSRVSMESGRPSEEELRIDVDPFLAAQYGLTVLEIGRQIGGTQDVSAGYQTVGRRTLNISVDAGYTPDELRSQILTWRDGRPVRLGDVAEVAVKRSQVWNFAFQNGNPALGLRVIRESGANVLSTLDQVKAAAVGLEPELEAKGLTIRPSFDPSVFIKRAINLLAGNLMIGILLAIGVLWLFLRQVRATLLIALTIPICLLTTFAVLETTGRTLNVISLAGLAFAVGMVLDAAIVVLENIVRLREKGTASQAAADQGAGQVWGALLASTATTVAIFVPVIFMKDVEGQLFADLALTIAIGVSVSLIVAVTILPVAARLWLNKLPKADDRSKRLSALAGRIVHLTDTPKRRIAMVCGLMALPLVLTWALLPPLSYLPPVKRDAVDAFIGFPPGTSIETKRDEVAMEIDRRLMPFFTGEREPALKNWYTIGGPWGMSIGARVEDQTRVGELERMMQEEVLVGFPDTFGGARQGNLFGGFGDEGSISLNLQSADTDAVRSVALAGMRLLQEAIPGANVNPQPYPELSQPELRFVPKDERLRELGWTREDLTRVVQFFSAGLYLGEYFDGTVNMNIILGSKDWTTPEELLSHAVVTPTGALVPLSEVADVETTVGAGNIRRVDGRRTYSLQINPPDDMALSKALVPENVLSGLQKLGHTIAKLPESGVTQAVGRDAEGKLIGVHDPRVPGKVGYAERPKIE